LAPKRVKAEQTSECGGKQQQQQTTTKTDPLWWVIAIGEGTCPLLLLVDITRVKAQPQQQQMAANVCVIVYCWQFRIFKNNCGK
jgi:hypothetical protein